MTKSVLREAAQRSARLTQWLIISVVLAFLAACQGATTHQAAAPKPPVDPEWWLDSLNQVRDPLADAILDACPRQGLVSNDKCVRAKIVESFATQGSAHMRCDMDEPTGGFLLCADLFIATERTYVLLGLDPKKEITSDDPYDSLAAVSQLVATRVTSKCGEAAQVDCVSGELAHIFAMDRSSTDRCVLSSDVKRQVNCALGLIRIEGYKSALLTLNRQ